MLWRYPSIIYWIGALLSLAQVGVSVDYAKLLAALEEDGLVRDHVKRSIHSSTNQITGVQTAGCPLGVGKGSHSISKRSLEDHQAAEHVLDIYSDLVAEHGVPMARNLVKRSVDFRQLNCQDGWAPCDHLYKYRSIDGRCNNLDHPAWGAALVPQLRYAPSVYSDDVGAPRLYTANGDCLPSARNVSKMVHMSSPTPQKVSGTRSHMLMLWGQFIDHDITLTPQRQTLTSCCTYEGVWRDSLNTGKCQSKTSSSAVRQRLRTLSSNRDRQSRRLVDQQRLSSDVCMGLEVDDDTFGFGHTCIDFQRSVAVPSSSCDLGIREQINQVTAFIDGSHIYGSTEIIAKELRTQVNGTLNTSGHNFLPPEDDSHQELYSECVKGAPPEYCFKAGDIRVNVQPGLSSIHTLFMNEHNRIAAILAQQVPPGINNADEFIYQETRRIIGAVLQHITYTEFLPILLGNANMRKYNLLHNKIKRNKQKYSSQHQPGIRNEFSTFAFRVGHSLVPEGLVPTDASYAKHGSGMSSFDNLLMSPHLVYQYGVGDVLRGVIAEPAKQPSPQLSHHLEKAFRHSNRTVGGLDLAAVNIQRGRDHGTPSYTMMRKYCRLPVPKTFADLDMVDENKERLSRVYQSVEDIDAWTGAVSERRVPGAMVGRLNACIIGRQFRSLRKGDRFWYEFQQPRVGFTTGQLEELYNASLAKILCNNLDMATVQPKVFYLVQWNQLENGRVPCDQIPGIDLSNWFNK